MNPVAILYALSVFCLCVAGLMAAYAIWDWMRLNRQMRQDRSFDPVRTKRTPPNWINRNKQP